MKRWRKIFLILLTAVFACSMFGCVGTGGGGGFFGGGNKKQVVRYWLFCNTTELNKLKDAVNNDFYKQYDNIEISFEVATGDYYTKLLTWMSSGIEPDIFNMEPGEIYPFLNYDKLQPLDEWLNDGEGLEADDLWAINDLAYRYDGTEFNKGSMYAVIKDWTPDSMLVYNRKLMNAEQLAMLERGTPLTFEEFETLNSQLIKKSDGKYTQYGYLPGLGSGKELCQFIDNAGTCWFTSDGTPQFTDPTVAKAVETYYNVLKANEAHKLSTSSYVLFKSGNLAMTLTGRYAIAGYQLEDMDLGITYPPVLSQDITPSVYTTGCVALAMAKRSKVKDAAWKFIEWYTEYYGVLGAKEGYNFPGKQAYGEEYMLNMNGSTYVTDPKVLAINQIFYDAMGNTSIIERNKYCSQAEFETALLSYDSSYLGGNNYSLNKFTSDVQQLLARTVKNNK